MFFSFSSRKANCASHTVGLFYFVERRQQLFGVMQELHRRKVRHLQSIDSFFSIWIMSMWLHELTDH